MIDKFKVGLLVCAFSALLVLSSSSGQNRYRYIDQTGAILDTRNGELFQLSEQQLGLISYNLTTGKVKSIKLDASPELMDHLTRQRDIERAKRIAECKEFVANRTKHPAKVSGAKGFLQVLEEDRLSECQELLKQKQPNSPGGTDE